MSFLNYWWLWKNRPEQTCSASRCTSRPGEYDRKRHFRKHINLGMPLKAHSNNHSSFPGCKACRAESTDTGDRGGWRSGSEPESKSAKREPRGRNKPWKVVSRCQYLRTRPPGDSTMTDSSHFPSFFLGWMCFPENTLMRTHIYDQQSYMDFTSFFFSLWAWVTFLSDFIVSVRISVDDDYFIKMFGYLYIYLSGSSSFLIEMRMCAHIDIEHYHMLVTYGFLF